MDTNSQYCNRCGSQHDSKNIAEASLPYRIFSIDPFNFWVLMSGIIIAFLDVIRSERIPQGKKTSCAQVHGRNQQFDFRNMQTYLIQQGISYHTRNSDRRMRSILLRFLQSQTFLQLHNSFFSIIVILVHIQLHGFA